MTISQAFLFGALLVLLLVLAIALAVGLSFARRVAVPVLELLADLGQAVRRFKSVSVERRGDGELHLGGAFDKAPAPEPTRVQFIDGKVTRLQDRK